MNPWFLAYSDLTGMLDVAKPGAIIITGRGNRYDPAFQEARKRGAKVYTYWNITNVPDNLKNPEDQAQYLINGQPPPRWPHKTTQGKDRSQYPGTYLLDTRPGSPWLKHIVPLTGDVVDKRKFDGFFLDTLGARPWSHTRIVNGVPVPGADWEDWPVAEQQAWAECSANIAREVADEITRRNPGIEIVHNNIWSLPKIHPAVAVNELGPKQANGCCLENASGDVPSEFHKNYAGRSFGRLPRRVLVIDTTDADTILWSKVTGVTHVCSVEKAKGETYAKVTPAVVPYEGWPPEEMEEQLEVARARIAELTAENTALHAQLAEVNQKVTDLEVEVKDLNEALAKIHELSAP